MSNMPSSIQTSWLSRLIVCLPPGSDEWVSTVYYNGQYGIQKMKRLLQLEVNWKILKISVLVLKVTCHEYGIIKAIFDTSNI